MKWSLRLLIIIALVLSTSACGVRLAYNHLDWLAMRWVNKQVTLNPAQELAFRDALEMKLDWHCASELPNYVPFLDEVSTTLSADRLDVNELERLGERASIFGQRLIDRIMPSVVNLFASLNDEQVDELLAGVDKRNQDFIDRRIVVEPDQRQRQQVESMQNSLKRFIGCTTEAQDARLEQWAMSIEFVAPRMLVHQQRWRNRLESTLDQREQLETFGPALTELFQPAGDWPDDLRAVMEFNRALTLEALVDIHALMSPRQKRRLSSRIESLQDDFERLSCR